MKRVFFIFIFSIQMFLCFSQEKRAFVGTIFRESFTKESVEFTKPESEIYWILYCDDNIKRQLVFQEKKDYSKYLKYVNKKVMIFGEIIKWETAHHKTEELISVMNIQEINETEQKIYEYISNNIMNNSQSVILESTNETIDISKIKISEEFGDTQNPFTGKYFFRDYIAYPYYSIRKVCSALDGEVVKITKEKENSIIIKTSDIEIEYFGWIKIDENLKVGDEIVKGTYLGTLFGGGDSGMKLKIRMKYNGSIINPSLWF